MKRVRLSSKIRKACQGSSSGFTLIEVLIALALIGIIAIAFLSAISTASMALITADERATAESLARSEMEHVKSPDLDYDFNEPQSYEHGPEEALPDHPGYFISVSAEPLHSPDDGIQLITVNVTRDGKDIITLEDYKRLP